MVSSSQHSPAELVRHLQKQQTGELLDMVVVAHAVVAQGEPEFHASTCVLACRRTGEALPEPWAVAVAPQFLDYLSSHSLPHSDLHHVQRSLLLGFTSLIHLTY